ncbi:unnamed protein product [Echinostoma caproni]|uniref:Deleted in azoospermia-associated protein 2 n=1 Tax=Echinostoma caproni TaxID=27848 RepID=A0A183AGP4_9TREM|nr:unnamed protein product [Echinostoma caproni]
MQPLSPAQTQMQQRQVFVPPPPNYHPARMYSYELIRYVNLYNSLMNSGSTYAATGSTGYPGIQRYALSTTCDFGYLSQQCMYSGSGVARQLVNPKRNPRWYPVPIPITATHLPYSTVPLPSMLPRPRTLRIYYELL